MATPEQIREVVAQYAKRVAAGSASEIADLYTPDAIVEDPVGTPPHEGRAAIESFYGALSQAEITTELQGVRVAGNSAAFGLKVIAKTGDQTITVEPIDVMTFGDDGKITSMRAFWSQDDMTVE
ncbi:nuclear transport factor 2 family protein [Hoyosella subflava]|uniref:Putative 3-ketosteroid 5-isomerase n=1 Tax=Hoyosella subflava (strain DSM 45089 / JCM 17490 / NBRC 109087 / DQS3-9A1) TaxID=443218 RepID=F6EPH3_HOYSD|nr:nuclear transport factor 2 family protein [Hoyosella subflava]AEF39406.1 Putative 3-ketosteroid 5-isomerase [Hoyosella subflava DQS3-9A1]